MAKGDPRIIIVCAWCEHVLGTRVCIPEMAGQLSHGICTDCLRDKTVKRPKHDPDDLRCTAPRCRQKVDPGHGIQWIDDKGNEQRFCTSCWTKLWKEKESETSS